MNKLQVIANPEKQDIFMFFVEMFLNKAKKPLHISIIAIHQKTLKQD